VQPLLQLPPSDVFAIIQCATELLMDEPPVMLLTGAFTIVGDLHGDIDSLFRIFSRLGWPGDRDYLFLGDYVDRGPCSTHVILVLYCLKVLFPRAVILLRGNHECRSISSEYGFKEECNQLFEPLVYDRFAESFEHLPIAAIVNGSTFCVHAGISPGISGRDNIMRLQKPTIDPIAGIEGDLLWSDFEPYVEEDYEENIARGAGFVFGRQFTESFLKRSGFERIIRSHQTVDDGFQWTFGMDAGCLTVFSSVDYMGQVNDGAVVTISDGRDLAIEVFHPLLGQAGTRWKLLLPEFVLKGRAHNGMISLAKKPARPPSEPDVLLDDAEVGIKMGILCHDFQE
jgi:serine/threonine-protein phosphatase PP1 catalytic subunit